MIVEIGVINSSIRFEDSIRKRIGRPIRFEIRFKRKKNDSQVPRRQTRLERTTSLLHFTTMNRKSYTFCHRINIMRSWYMCAIMWMFLLTKATVMQKLFMFVSLYVCAMIENNNSASAASSSRYDATASLANSFVPGAISNRALEHLTETMVRPQQYRAIRGEHQPLPSSQYVPRLLMLCTSSRISVVIVYNVNCLNWCNNIEQWYVFIHSVFCMFFHDWKGFTKFRERNSGKEKVDLTKSLFVLDILAWDSTAWNLNISGILP